MICGQVLQAAAVSAREITVTVQFSFVRSLRIMDTKCEAPDGLLAQMQAVCCLR